MRPGRWLCVALLCGATVARADLVARPDLAEGVQSLPRLVGGGSATARINARLAELDTEARDFAADCNSDPPNSFFERAITVTMTGPRYLSVHESGGFYCPGAAHPNTFQTPLTFDLASGQEVDFRNLVPSRFWEESEYAWPNGDLQATPALVALYFDQASTLDDECREAISTPPLGFLMWPDADTKGLVLMPSSLPYVMTACADAVTLPLEVLRREGFAPALIDALENGKAKPPR